MSNKILNINFNTGNIIDDVGAIVMSPPTISYQAAPNWELHFCTVDETSGILIPVNLSGATTWTSAVDTDFDSSSEPMCRTLNSGIDSSQASSGIIVVSLDANTTTFYDKVNKRNSIPAYFEIRGSDSGNRVIYDYRFRINALGAIDPQGSQPLPPPGEGAVQKTTELSGTSVILNVGNAYTITLDEGKELTLSGIEEGQIGNTILVADVPGQAPDLSGNFTQIDTLQDGKINICQFESVPVGSSIIHRLFVIDYFTGE